MKKNVSSISHNQGHEVVLQIENALKNAGEDPGEKISDLIKEKFFYKTIVDFLKKGGKFVSKIFRKTTVLSIKQDTKEFTVNESSVMEFLGSIIERERELKNPTPWIDNDIWNYFINKVIPGIIKDFTMTIYRFITSLTHKQILDEAEKMGIKKVYSFLEGLFIVREAVLSGEVDEKGKGIIVYFKVEGIDTSYRFVAWRFADGQLGLGVSGVASGRGDGAGYGACFSN